MNVQAVVALIVGTLIVLGTPALILSTDLPERLRTRRSTDQEK